MVQTPQTPNDYYTDEENFGLYQYVSLKDIVDGMLLETQEDDSYLKNTKRSKILFHAKQGIRELTRSVANDILAFEITVPDSLVFPLPQDFVNYVRISVVTLDSTTGSYRLEPLDINYKINSAIGYLQDHNADLLFDNEGYILMADSMNAIAKPYKKYSFSSCYQPTLNASKLSKSGEFTIDERRGLILFSSELADREIVIEYVSDGLHAELHEEEITIHKYLKKALEDYIYLYCIDKKRNIPMNEKQKALQRYKATRHEAVMARANFDLLRISRAVRANSMS